MPEALPSERYVAVNIADASVLIADHGTTLYRGPVVIGREDRPTPFVRSVITRMIINPSWHVPRKIAQEDILPKLRENPHYLEDLDIVLRDRPQDPYGATIDWRKITPGTFTFHLRQLPGEQNSLGRLKFEFDNTFDVYMHGTPHQDLFARSQRNFSSGCIRLRDPEEVAEVLLAANDGGWSPQKIEDAIASGKTRVVTLTDPIPIYALYETVFADDSGAIQFRKDVYDHDAALGLNE